MASSFGYNLNMKDTTNRESEVIDISSSGEDSLIPLVAHTNCLVGRLCSNKKPNSFHLLGVIKRLSDRQRMCLLGIAENPFSLQFW